MHVSPFDAWHPSLPQLDTQLPETHVVIPEHTQSPGQEEHVSLPLHEPSPQDAPTIASNSFPEPLLESNVSEPSEVLAIK